MEEKNKYISETFGKYNSSAGELENVSSKDWAPISQGRRADAHTAARQNTPRQNSRAQKSKSTGTSHTPSKKKPPASKAGPSAGDSFISQGRPDNKKGTNNKSTKKASSKKTQQSKKEAKSTPVSRTPKGRDMRRDAREQQKHREELFRFREDYKQQINSQLNHDEISYKRNEDKRKSNNRKNFGIIIPVLLITLSLIGIYFCSKGMIIEKVEISGNSIYTNEEIQQAVGIDIGKNRLSFREKKLKADLTEKLPYIKDVSVDYDFTDKKISLTVTGTSDRYVITAENSSFTLDADGKVVSEAAQEARSGIFFAEGFDFQKLKAGKSYKPEGMNEQRYILLTQFAEFFEKSGIVDTAVINLSNVNDVVVTVDGTIAVYFGDCKNLEEKVPFASGIVKTVRAAGKTGYIDMRYEDGYFKPGSMKIE